MTDPVAALIAGYASAQTDKHVNESVRRAVGSGIICAADVIDQAVADPVWLGTMKQLPLARVLTILAQTIRQGAA